MKYGICNCSVSALRHNPLDKSELTSQILYGESFMILEQIKQWSFVRLFFDGYKGWIDNKQFKLIKTTDYKKLTTENEILCAELLSSIKDEHGKPQPIVLGSILNCQKFLKHNYEGKKLNVVINKNKLIETSLMYINTPYLWGGKTPLGIDCSGFTQMVYRINGLRLKRDAVDQSRQGKKINFIKDSKPGDLAFFENNTGKITHVGIIMGNNHIIHSHGKVRIDNLDDNGIYNVELKKYSHRLKIIKNIIK